MLFKTIARRTRPMIFNMMSQQAEPLLHKIFAHDFNKELQKGILPIHKFVFYLKQDALYLSDFSCALARLSEKLSHPTHAEWFKQFSRDALQAEQDLHSKYLARYNSKSDMEKSPTCFMYTQHIFNRINTTVEEGLASVLPCFWVYQKVGEKMATQPTPNNPYQEWIDLYSNPVFKESVRLAIEATNVAGEAASEVIREKMIATFLRSTQLEWMFWDSAYQKEEWPVTAATSKSCLIPEALTL